MGLTAVRNFRDKLAMRERARKEGILGPEFVHVLNYDNLREFMSRVPNPWLLKPRSQASGIGMKKVHYPDQLWHWLDQLGDQQSFYLLEQFIPGAVYHVDSVVSERSIAFAEAHAYGTPPLDTSHEGGVFTTRTLPREAEETKSLLEINRDLIAGLGLVRGVAHAEFLRSHADGKFYFIEVAARVGGAYISDVIETATGINLWREWASLEVGGGNQPYQLPSARRDYAGVILSLARQEHPDTSAYTDPEITHRVRKYHHVGFILKSQNPERIRQLLDSYATRFQADFVATQPVPDKPSS
jgi:biotin carboxylase